MKEKRFNVYEKEQPLKTFESCVETIDGKRVVVYKERVSDPNEGLKWTDFEIQSLLDADAVDLLQPTSPIQRDNLTVADSADYFAGSIDADFGAALENNEPKKEVTNE